MIGKGLVLLGAVLMLVSAIGVVRFSDVMGRLHALSKASTLGLMLIFGGAAIDVTGLDQVTSVLLAALLHLLGSPPSSNMLSRATYLAQRGPHPVATSSDE